MKKQALSLALAFSVLTAGGLGAWYAHASANSAPDTAVKPSTQVSATTDNTSTVKEQSGQATEQPGQETSEALEQEKMNGKEEATEKDEAQEAAQLAKEATISAAQAEASALQKVPGTVEKTSLDNENGKVVYEVTVRDANGKTVEVKVDAKTGAVVKVEHDGEGHEEDVEHED